MSLQPDHALIAEWIRPGSRVLDLGCGDGTLLAYLQQQQRVQGHGLEIDPDNIVKCIATGVQAIHYDLDAGLSCFGDASFDYVVMTQTLQAVHFPQRLLAEMLRVGEEGIVTFANLGHWRCRLQLGLGGHMPTIAALPHPWYRNPYIRPCSVDDFERLCRDMAIEVLERSSVDHAHRRGLGMRTFPNLLGELAIYRLRRSPA